MRFHAPPGAPLQAAVDRLHGHGIWLPTFTGQATTASSTPLAATCVADAATAHTKGAWVEVTPATTTDWHGFTLVLTSPTSSASTDTSTLLDVGIGGAGSEVVVVPNMNVGFWAVQGQQWDVPVSIPRGNRVAIRCQSAVLSKNVATYTVPWANNVTRFTPPPKLVNIGANTATSYGVALTTPAGANTKGAWSELTASASHALHAVVVCIGGAADVGMTGSSQLVDIGVGAAGSEVVAISNLGTSASNSEGLVGYHATLHPVNIPVGARVAARYQTTHTATALDVVLIGVPA